MNFARWAGRCRVRPAKQRSEPVFPLRQPAAELPDSPERRLILRAVQELAGAPCVLYDVPRAAAPQPLGYSSIYLRGSPAWQRYLAARRRADDGALKLLLALRPLSERERLLAVDWGTTYANTLMLIEPRYTACDLTAARSPVYRRLEEAARGLLAGRRPTDDPAVPWTRATELGDILRDQFGIWVYWTREGVALQAHRLPLRPSRPDETLADLVSTGLVERFPQEAFERALDDLLRHEKELFHSEVAWARMPFRTRLGLPILYDPRCVDRALRRLVNAGRASLYRYAGSILDRYGAGRPVPEDMPDEEFERLII